jgi:hypothetical protein
MEAIPFCVMWCIWKEQNATSFEGCESSVYGVEALVLMIIMWISGGFFFPFFFSNLLEFSNLLNLEYRFIFGISVVYSILLVY